MEATVAMFSPVRQADAWSGLQKAGAVVLAVLTLLAAARLYVHFARHLHVCLELHATHKAKRQTLHIRHAYLSE